MTGYVIVAVASGVLFGILDVVINANPLAARLYQAYKPITRKSLNPVAGMAIDIAFGFVMAGVFLLLYGSLPGGSGLLKGLSFALVAWFFRVVMSAASHWMLFQVPARTLLYSPASGLAETLILGVLYGLTLSRHSLAVERRESIEQDVVRFLRIGHQRRLYAGKGFYRKAGGPPSFWPK